MLSSSGEACPVLGAEAFGFALPVVRRALVKSEQPAEDDRRHVGGDVEQRGVPGVTVADPDLAQSYGKPRWLERPAWKPPGNSHVQSSTAVTARPLRRTSWRTMASSGGGSSTGTLPRRSVTTSPSSATWSVVSWTIRLTG